MKRRNAIVIAMLLLCSCSNRQSQSSVPQMYVVSDAVKLLASDHPEQITTMMQQDATEHDITAGQTGKDAQIAHLLFSRYGVTEQKYWQLQYDTTSPVMKMLTIIVPIENAHLFFDFNLAAKQPAVLRHFHIRYLKT